MSKGVWIRRTEDWIKIDQPPHNGATYALKSKIKNKVKPIDSGVYVIICEREKCAYVGQSINMGARMRNHKLCIVGHSN